MERRGFLGVLAAFIATPRQLLARALERAPVHEPGIEIVPHPYGRYHRLYYEVVGITRPRVKGKPIYVSVAIPGPALGRAARRLTPHEALKRRVESAGRVAGYYLRARGFDTSSHRFYLLMVDWHLNDHIPGHLKAWPVS